MKKKKTARQSKLKIKKRLNQKKKDSKKELVIYVFNVVEDEWSFLSSIQPLEKRFESMNISNFGADCYLFSNAAHEEFIYISPVKISNSFKKYFHAICNVKRADILVPIRKTGLVCKDLYTDKILFNDLVKKAKKYKKIKLISYATSPEFYELKERLIQVGVNVFTPETPDIENAWTVNFYGSKSGIRQLAQQSRAIEPDFIMPDGVICVGKLDAAKIAANRYIHEKGVVLKTNKGSNGHGVLIFRDGELPRDYESCEKRIYELLSEDGYWDRFPIIIEQLINVNYNNISSFPNIEFKIHKSGNIEMLYYCLMMVTGEGEYLGLDMNEDLINERMAARIIDTGYFIAEQYSDSGYRGHFDIDLIASGNTKIYVCESNTRNTAGTDVFKLTRDLFGKNFFTNVYVISRIDYTFKTQKQIDFDYLLKRLQPVLYNKPSKEGVIVSSSAFLATNDLVYIIYGANKRRAYKIQSNLLEILNSIV